MSDAQARGWGDPDAKGYAAQHIIKISAGGVKLNVRREVAPLFQGFVDELVATGYILDVNPDDWGYNNRDIRGRPGVKSNHAWGLALDLNSGTNPMTEDGKAHTDMNAAVVRPLAHKWGLFWGADYSSDRRDPMHFEFLGTPADVKNYPTSGTVPRPTPTEDEYVKHTFYRISVDAQNSKTADDDGGIWVTTDDITTHLVSGPAWTHAKNLGWWDESNVIFVPKGIHDWMVGNTRGDNTGDK